MPRFGQLNEGKYLKKEDFPKPALLTIRAWARENVARENEPPEFKWIMYFNEPVGESNTRGFVVNSTNEQLLQIATGCTGTEDSIGKKIVVYHDPTVSMGGKLVGGLRIRGQRQSVPGPAATPSPEPDAPSQAAGSAEPDDDVPF